MSEWYWLKRMFIKRNYEMSDQLRAFKSMSESKVACKLFFWINSLMFQALSNIYAISIVIEKERTISFESFPKVCLGFLIVKMCSKVCWHYLWQPEKLI